MAWTVTADPQRFEEAIAWFRAKLPRVDDGTLSRFARSRAFTISGVAELDIIQSIYDLIVNTITEGVGIDDFRDLARESLTSNWLGDNPSRIDLIYRNATQSAYNAGRWRQMTDPEVLAIRPYGLFDGIDDSRQTPICRDCDGTLLPLSHEWWASHHPPLHHNCRSSLRNLTEAQARARGISAEPPATPADTTWGEPPTEAEWRPDARDYDSDLYRVYRSHPTAMLLPPLGYLPGGEPSAKYSEVFAAWHQATEGVERFRFEAKTKDDLELNFLDEIGLNPKTGSGITAAAVKAVLDAYPQAKSIRAVINSPGGHAYEGVAIHSLLRRHGARITTEVVGIAASAASLIAMAGDRIEMHVGSELMIHRASGLTFGNSKTHEQTARVLADLDRNQLAIYADRTKIRTESLEAMLDAETWLGAEQALALGFASKIISRTKPEPAPVEESYEPTALATLPYLAAIAAHRSHP